MLPFIRLLLALYLCATPATAQFSRVIDNFAAQVCNTAVGFFTRPNGLFQCSCDASFTVNNGLEVAVDCEFVRPRCIGPLCGTSTVTGLLTPRGIQDAELCVFFGGDNTNSVPPVCLAGGGAGFGRLATCDLFLGSELCDCQVCEGGRSVALDCSSITLDTPLFLPSFSGPKFGECIEAEPIANFMGAFAF